MTKRLLSQKEAAEYLGVTRSTLWRWTKLGRIPYVDMGTTRYDIKELNKTIEECTRWS